MGGVGSGWRRPRRVACISEVPRLDVLALCGQSRHLSPTRMWQAAGGARVITVASEDRVSVIYDRWQGVFPVVPIRCGYRGTRPLFCCWRCDGRTRYLYLGRGGAGCRKCLNLRYDVELIAPKERAERGMVRLYRRLAPGTNPTDWDWKLPPRPKGMHRATYLQLEARFDRLVAIYGDWLARTVMTPILRAAGR